VAASFHDFPLHAAQPCTQPCTAEHTVVVVEVQTPAFAQLAVASATAGFAAASVAAVAFATAAASASAVATASENWLRGAGVWTTGCGPIAAGGLTILHRVCLKYVDRGGY